MPCFKRGFKLLSCLVSDRDDAYIAEVFTLDAQISVKSCLFKLKFSEKTTKFEKIFHLKFDITQKRQILSGRFFQIMSASQNVQTLTKENCFRIIKT